MDIPYDLIHELEDQYGTITLVSENNPILLKIRQKMHIKANNYSLYDFNEYKKHQIIYYINEGYGVSETANLVRVSYKRVHNIIKKNKLIVKPRFKYVVTKEGKRTFSTGLNQYKAICKFTCSNFAQTQRSLYKLGYKLSEAAGYYHWCDINPNDQYIIDCEVYTK